MDAVVFLRFTRMIRNIFLILTPLGLVIILPVVLSSGGGPAAKVKRQITGTKDITKFIRMTPQFSNGPRFWAYTFVAYLFDAIICFFIYWNYRKVTELRRRYLKSPEYMSSLHSRTLMVSFGTWKS